MPFAGTLQGEHALLEMDEPVRANPASIATYVATGLVDGLEDTFFEGITRFPAATTLEIGA